MRYVTYAIALLVLLGGLWIFWDIFSQNAAAGWLTIIAIVTVVIGLLTRTRHIHHRKSRDRHSTVQMNTARMMIRKEEGNVHHDHA